MNNELEMGVMYRFADKKDQVNWDFTYRPDDSFMDFMIPYMLDYAEGSIKRVTFEDKDLRAVIGLSGGLDSCVSAWLVARAMQRGIERGTSDSGRLALITFDGMSKEDLEYGRQFGEDMIRDFPGLDIQYVERDLRPMMSSIHRFTDGLVSETKGTKRYPGELATRLIDLLTLEYADKAGHCGIDSTNGSEIVLGEIVLGAGLEYSPICDIYKSQVFDLGDRLGMPSYVIDRNPINSTFGTDKIHSYFGEIPEGLGAREVYGVVDPVLYHIWDLKLKPEEIIGKTGHSLEFLKNLYKRVRNQDHRREHPFFSITDKEGESERTVTSRPNSDFERYMERCFRK